MIDGKSLVRFTFLTLMVAGGALPLRATTVLPPNFETLVGRAELIFTGQVAAQHAEWRTVNGQRSIVTLVSFGVEQALKGRAGSVVTLQFLGGTVADVTLDVSEMPKFKTGDRAVLFVEGNGTMVCPLIGFQHGRFTVRKETDGRETVLKYDGAPLTQTDDSRASEGGCH